MKNIIITIGLALIYSISFGNYDADFNCIWKSWFTYPKNNSSYEEGKAVYVLVDVQKQQDIDWIELYVNGKRIRKETKHPYEWCKGSGGDNYLRHLKKGTYKLKAKIKDECGKYHEIYCTFYVKGGEGSPVACAYKASFKYPENGKYYPSGSDVYVKLDVDSHSKIKYTELFVNGKFVRKETNHPYEWAKGGGNSDSYLRNVKPGTYKLKCRVYDKCDKYKDYYCTFYVKGGEPSDQVACEYKAWFKYPQNGKYFNSGSDVYVYVDAQKYENIKYTELYVNDKKVRKESNYPYEWAKGSSNTDSKLRNLKPGTYKLKCRVYDKCGKYKDYYCTFYVKGGGETAGGNGNGNGEGDYVCKYKSWYKYPKNNGTYRYGDDVYVRVDTEKYQDIKEMHLYVNGKFVRKETNYPYEWCKGNGNSDGYLRNLKRGTYNLKTRVKTDCGQWYEYFCKFYVR